MVIHSTAMNASTMDLLIQLFAESYDCWNTISHNLLPILYSNNPWHLLFVSLRSTMSPSACKKIMRVGTKVIMINGMYANKCLRSMIKQSFFHALDPPHPQSMHLHLFSLPLPPSLFPPLPSPCPCLPNPCGMKVVNGMRNCLEPMIKQLDTTFSFV